MLEDKIYQDYVAALKAKEKAKSQFLSFLRAELQNKAKALKQEKLQDPLVIGILKKQRKKIEESRDIVAKAGKSEAAGELEREIAIIDKYLPPSLSREELAKIIDEVISQAQASGMKDMGRVMKLSLEKIASQADAKLVSEVVREKLSGKSS